MLRWPFTRKRSSVAAQVDPQLAYSLWARNYPPWPHNRLMEVEHDTVLDLLPDVRGLTVLDAGCGTGRYLGELQSRGAIAMGVDLSMAMLERVHDAAGRIVRADVR